MSEVIMKKVCKSYQNGAFAVKDFNLEIKDKDFLVLVGPSGCGKSTTLRMIAGLEEITSGELWIDNKLANFLEAGERGLSMVFQNYALYPYMNVYENMAFGLRVHKLPKDEIDRRVHEAARILEIEHLLNRNPSALSGGQKQRVAIGSVMVRQPKLYLMDEPLSNLDAKLRTQMRVELSKLHRKLGATVVYVTHDQVEAMTLGTKIVVMKAGVIQQAAAPEVLYNNPINKFVADFIGSPAMNFIDMEVKEEADGFYLTAEGQKIRTEGIVKQALKFGGYAGRKVTFGIRPENLIYESEETGKDDGCYLEAEINVREMLGAEVLLHGTAAGSPISVKAPTDCPVLSGQTVRFRIQMGAVKLFDMDTEDNILYKEM